MTRRILVLLFVLLVGGVAAAGTVTLEADRDATLIERADGDLALGASPSLFVGATAQGEGAASRRALIRFDVASAIPRNASIVRVELSVAVLPSNPGPHAVRLHRVLADWGEGTSVGFGGRGVPAEPGDATWIHTFHDDATWVRPGGQFVAAPSAEFVLGDPGLVVLEGSAKMLADVRAWAAAPERNFGWIWIGEEDRPFSVQILAAREMAIDALRPRLTVEYRLPGERGRR
jgi:hypothetical protein